MALSPKAALAGLSLPHKALSVGVPGESRQGLVSRGIFWAIGGNMKRILIVKL